MTRYIYQEQTRYSISLLDMQIAHENVLNGLEEIVFITEHEGVYTAGKSYSDQDILCGLSMPLYFPGRGGRITVHSRGQIVIYPIINLRKRGLHIAEYVKILENWMIDVLKYFGIEGYLSGDGVGVWCSRGKIGFVGVKIEKGVSIHGVCLNISNDLSLFKPIVPCGLLNVKITSICEIAPDVSIQDVVGKVVKTSPFS